MIRNDTHPDLPTDRKIPLNNNAGIIAASAEYSPGFDMLGDGNSDCSSDQQTVLTMIQHFSMTLEPS